METQTGHLRIGELSRRTEVAPELLRAWERRYGLLHPARSDGGFRLYSDADERRGQLMRQYLREGLAAAEAARLALEGADARALPQADERPELEAGTARMRAALDAFEENAAQEALDDLFAAFTVETVLRVVLLPYLAELGDRWSTGGATVAQEHFASNLIRGRLLGIGRGWDGGDGPRGRFWPVRPASCTTSA